MKAGVEFEQINLEIEGYRLSFHLLLVVPIVQSLIHDAAHGDLKFRNDYDFRFFSH